jgi:hypothetical protein
MGLLLEGCCHCCCSPLRARYKRLVDNIFPVNPQDGLIKSNMEKLQYYASSSPEKLDRIGDYFAHKISRDLTRHQYPFVVIAMDAMDQLLHSCNSQSLNSFIESYLKVVQLLLETQDPGMQIVATTSFTKFANIDEDTPSYHRRYDFFVSKFSSLCHDNNTDPEIRRQLRVSGLKGLKGVILKTVSDDLQVDIWDDHHMDKIVPSLLYNMQDNQSDRIDSAACVSPAPPASPSLKNAPIELPCLVAEDNLRELVGKATFGNIRSVIRPVLRHLDLHDLWHSEELAVQFFRVIMTSIQNQYSYAVIQSLMTHLDEKSKSKSTESSIKIRTGIATVLSQVVAISASGSIGPIVLDIINNLLNHLRSSINNCQSNIRCSEGEKKFQETVINSLGEFANNLPDFQKIEIMNFIISRVPAASSPSRTDSVLQSILLRSLLKVSKTYNTVNISQALPTAFLKSLLQFALTPDPKVRVTVQNIFHQLLDRHNNLPKIMKPGTLAEIPPLTVEKAFRQDVVFIKKHGIEIIGNINENIQLTNNSAENYCALYTTIALLCVEMSSEELVTETVRLSFSMQDFAISSTTLSEQHKAAIHALTAAVFHMSSQLTGIPALTAHVSEVIKNRSRKCPAMLPESNRYFTPSCHMARRPSLISSQEAADADLLFDKQVIVDVLKSTGHETSHILQALSTRSVVDAAVVRSEADCNGIDVEIASICSTPETTRVPDSELTFDSFKKILSEPESAVSDEKLDRRMRTIEKYRTTPFESLTAELEKSAASALCVSCVLSQIVQKLSN